MTQCLLKLSLRTITLFELSANDQINHCGVSTYSYVKEAFSRRIYVAMYAEAGRDKLSRLSGVYPTANLDVARMVSR